MCYSGGRLIVIFQIVWSSRLCYDLLVFGCLSKPRILNLASSYGQDSFDNFVRVIRNSLAPSDHIKRLQLYLKF
jgi:hypothetical protein